MSPNLHLPTTLIEMEHRGWDRLDIVLVTGDAYVDHPSFGAAVIGRVLEAAGYRVGLLPQPDWRSVDEFRSLGEPRLFFGITAGNMDSMVNHYTAHRRLRSEDAYTPGGTAGKRPDRAVLVYAQRCKEAYKGVPIVLGGIEASLRRLAHYDYWDNAVRRSILFDAKADLLVYGQGEKTIVELAHGLASGRSCPELNELAGVAVIRREWDELAARWGREVVVLPSFEEVRENKQAFALASRHYHREHNPANARILVQPHAERAVVIMPPMPPPTSAELDRIWALPFTRRPHPRYEGERIVAWEQIRNSIQILRGCFAGCAFCALSEHQGRQVSSRSSGSVLAEIRSLVEDPEFRGTISDLGGPTANMWQMGCGDPEVQSSCRRSSCIHPTVCVRLERNHGPLLELYRRARKEPGVRHLFVASGIRYDLAYADDKNGERYLRELVAHHVSGQLKVAPEHVGTRTLETMRKPPISVFERFRADFERFSKAARKEQYLVPYFLSSHPGCSLADAAELHDYLRRHHWKPQQVQDFMPTPMTLATDMYYSGLDPTTMKPVAITKELDQKRMQKALCRWADPALAPWYDRAMEALGRRERFNRRFGAERADSGQAPAESVRSKKSRRKNRRVR